MGGARPGAPSRVRNPVRFCEVCKSPHTQVSLDLSALCEVCEVVRFLDKKIKLEPNTLAAVGTGGGEEKQDLALKPRKPRTPHTMLVLCGSFVCEVFVGAKNAHTGQCEISICPQGVRR